MTEYGKTENLFSRSEETRKLILGDFRRQDFGQVDRWGVVTEKIDGTNVRLILDAFHRPARAEVRGRSDAATLPKNFVLEALPHLLLPEGGIDPYPLLQALAAITDKPVADLDSGEYSMVIYGEGYGPGIQKGGGNYATKKSFRIFDVVTYRGPQYSGGRLWRTWEDVETVAEVLGLKTAPVLLRGAPTDAIVDFVREGLYSQVAAEESGIPEAEVLQGMEGVIARTDPYLYDYRSNRVFYKLKGHDLP